MKVFTIITVSLLYFFQAQAQVAVIANKSVPVDKIDKSTLIDYYARDIWIWNNDEPVTVFDLKTKSNVKERFYNFLGKSPSRMKSIWMKQMLSGEGKPPEALESENDMLEKVSSTPGSIGFISNSKVTSDVKILMEINSD
jgi:ABC-type phosphate transport system substrate-binding protein